ncbi:MAG: methyltransferase domain-containing protein [Alkalicoccus sp.]|nr:MAG: methyltransferase domain-containing protein [Alkalicoccus sp.]
MKGRKKMRKFTAEEFDEKTAFFDAMACSPWFYNLQEELWHWNGFSNPVYLLDVGCGTGRMLIRKSDSSQKAVGIDISAGMIQVAEELAARQNKNVDFLQGDAESMPFEDQVFDTVMCTCVLFLMPDPSRMVREIFRVLRPGGHLALLNPAPHLTEAKAEKAAQTLSPKERPMLIQWGKVAEKRHRFSQKAMKELLQKEGFQKVDSCISRDGLGMLTTAAK